jgi:hypothetical protein
MRFLSGQDTLHLLLLVMAVKRTGRDRLPAILGFRARL